VLRPRITQMVRITLPPKGARVMAMEQDVSGSWAYLGLHDMDDAGCRGGEIGESTICPRTLYAFE